MAIPWRKTMRFSHQNSWSVFGGIGNMMISDKGFFNLAAFSFQRNPYIAVYSQDSMNNGKNKKLLSHIASQPIATRHRENDVV